MQGLRQLVLNGNAVGLVGGQNMFTVMDRCVCSCVCVFVRACVCACVFVCVRVLVYCSLQEGL